jgi:FkbM family methyltransferase
MRNVYIKPGSPVRKLFPLVRRLRYWAWKFHDRTAQRLVISGGPVRLLDAELYFPDDVGLLYSTPLFWNGPNDYELPTSRVIATLAGRSKLFLDIGSNIGIYAVYVGVRFPAVKVFAFEPVPVIFEKNVLFHRANKLSDQTTLKIALSDRDGVQKLYLPVFTTGLEEEQTATLNAVSWQAYEKKVEVIETQCRTLDSFAAESPLPAGPCCIKIDVEGFEAPVFRGAKTFLRERRPWIVCELLPCEEFDPVTRTKHNNNSEVLAEIEAAGYVAFAITPEGCFRMNPPDFSRPRLFKDFLLVPREKISDQTLYLAPENLGEFFAA